MFDKLLARLSRVFAGADQAVRDRVRIGDAWLAGLTAEQAKTEAVRMLENPEHFVVVREPPTTSLPSWLPPATADFFTTFRSVRGRFSDLHLDAAEAKPSPTEEPLLQLGWYCEHVELCVSPVDGLVYRIADDVPGDDLREGSHPSLWHAVLRLGVELEYVRPPGLPTADSPQGA
jgi:hypothetical protein